MCILGNQRGCANWVGLQLPFLQDPVFLSSWPSPNPATTPASPTQMCILRNQRGCAIWPQKTLGVVSGFPGNVLPPLLAYRLASNNIRPLHRHQRSDTSSASEAPSQGAHTYFREMNVLYLKAAATWYDYSRCLPTRRSLRSGQPAVIGPSSGGRFHLVPPGACVVMRNRLL